MGILNRIADIMSANINAILDKAEDPVKMAKKYLADYMDDLADCKADLATIRSQRKAAQRAYDEAKAQVDKYATMARNAVKAGNDDDARKLLTKKQQAEGIAESKKQILDAAVANDEKLTNVYNKLVSDIEVLRQRVNDVEATAAVADAQETVAAITSKYGNGSKGADGINRMMDKAQARLDKAEAMTEIDAEAGSEDADLESKYGGSASSASVEDELAKLKAEMGA